MDLLAYFASGVSYFFINIVQKIFSTIHPPTLSRYRE